MTILWTAVGLSGLAAAAWFGIPIVVRGVAKRRLRNRCRADRLLVLTYDDGPGPKTTPQLLHLLDRYDAKATFFLLGSRAAATPEIVDEIKRHGHEVACHSQQHLDAWRVAPWRALGDVNAGFRSLSRWLPKGASFRPPFGRLSLLTWCHLKRRRTPIAWWTHDSCDTHYHPPSPTRVAERILEDRGGVVLFHDFDRAEECIDHALETTELLLKGAGDQDLTIMRFGDTLQSKPRQ